MQNNIVLGCHPGGSVLWKEKVLDRNHGNHALFAWPSDRLGQCYCCVQRLEENSNGSTVQKVFVRTEMTDGKCTAAAARR